MLKKIALSFIVVLMLWSCANIRARTGGEKDTEAPLIETFIPANQSVLFSGNSFSITFSEWIELSDITNQLVVSPPLNQFPEVTIRKKTLNVRWDEPLQPNATYSFNFGEGIVDYTEGNAAKNVSYVFSTGTYLDSLYLNGNVKNAFTKSPSENVKVMFYRIDEDSVVYREKPLYFGYTDEEGTYRIPHVGPGQYKCFALNDQNGNYLYESGEEMGFLDTLITAGDSLIQVPTIHLSVEAEQIQYIKDYSRDSTGFVKMKMAKKAIAPSFEVLGEQVDYVWENDSDSLLFWIISDPLNKDIELRVSENEFADTLSVMSFDVTPLKKQLSITPESGASHSALRPLYLRSDRYVQKIDPLVCKLKQDTTMISFDLVESDLKRRVEVEAELKSDKSYTLECAPGAFESLEGYTSDSVLYNFKTYPAEHYGDFTLTLPTLPSGQNEVVLRLTGKKGKIIEERKIKAGIHRFSQLMPDTYNAYILIDTNNNGDWDPASYPAHQQAEEIIHFPKEIALRSNWKLEFEWIIDEQ